MMRSFFSKTLYQKRLYLFWWVVAIMLMTIFTMAFFPSFKSGGFDQSFNTLPEALRKIAGDAAAFRTVGGYIDQQIFALRVPMLTIVMSIILFVGLTVGDERRGLTETQIALPVSRRRLMLEKLLAGALILAVACVFIVVAIMISLLLIRESYSVMSVAKAAFGCWLLSLASGLIAAAVAGLTGRRGLTIGIASFAAFGSYLVSSIGTLVSGLRSVDKFSLFHYYQNGSSVTAFNVTILAVVSLALVIIAIIGFGRRDIRTS